MRAARLLHILLLLQNRGRLTAGALARELEVAHRTILRDMDALTEAGLPIVAYQGNQGGFELGFSYRTRLTGLATDEAEALSVLLADPTGLLADLGLADAGRRAASKLRESLPDQVRATMQHTSELFRIAADSTPEPDQRLPAMARAIRERRRIRLRARSADPVDVHPEALIWNGNQWSVLDARSRQVIPLEDWADINISALTF